MRAVDTCAQLIHAALEANPHGLTFSQIQDWVAKNRQNVRQRSNSFQVCLSQLANKTPSSIIQQKIKGRPSRYFALQHNEPDASLSEPGSEIHLLDVIEHSEHPEHQQSAASASPRAVSPETTESPLDIGLNNHDSPCRDSASDDAVEVLPVPLNDRRDESTDKDSGCFLAHSEDAERSAATYQDLAEQRELQLHYGRIVVEIQDANDRCNALLQQLKNRCDSFPKLQSDELSAQHRRQDLERKLLLICEQAAAAMKDVAEVQFLSDWVDGQKLTLGIGSNDTYE